MAFTYRHCGVPEDVIFTAALFQGRPGERDAILAEMNAITDARQATQPVNTRTGGIAPSRTRRVRRRGSSSTGPAAGGCGSAAPRSPSCTATFLIAHPGASARDVEALGEEVRRRVREATGVALEWEIKRVGEP